LKENGRFGIIVQNSWMDADYGKYIQQFLLDSFEIEAILGTQKDRMIKTADINTVILLLEKQSDEDKRKSNDVKFVQLKKSVSWFERNYGFEELINRIDNSGEVVTDDFRILTRNQENLREEGMGATTYTGAKWGKYVRAPDIYFDLIEEYQDSMKPIGRQFDIGRGTRSGANEFFYLPNKHYSVEENEGKLILQPKGDEMPEFEIPEEYWRHKEQGESTPNYLLKNAQKFNTIKFNPTELELGRSLRYVLVFDEPRRKLPEEVVDYIEWGENHDTENCQFCRRDTPLNNSTNDRGKGWFDITSELKKGDILPMKNIGERPYYWVPESRVWIDDRLHGIETNSEEQRLSTAAILNSTLGSLLVEVNGRVGLGQGALDIASKDHGGIQIPIIRQLESDVQEKLIDKFNELAEKEVSSIFESMSADEADEVSIDEVERERRDLDKVVFEEILSLSKSEQLELYRGVVNLVKNRKQKAESGE
jgi:hypothetical protein